MLFFPAPEPEKMVYRTMSGANDKAGANRSRNIFFSQRYRSFERFATGQISGDSGGKRAAGAMSYSRGEWLKLFESRHEGQEENRSNGLRRRLG